MRAPKDLVAKRIVVKAVCPCKNEVRVRIADKGDYLPVWEVACQNHKNLHVKVVLGNIYVSGTPSDIDAAASLVRRAIKDKVPLIRTSEHEPFVMKVKF